METRLRDAGWGLQGEVTGKLSQAQPFASGKLKREAVCGESRWDRSKSDRLSISLTHTL